MPPLKVPTQLEMAAPSVCQCLTRPSFHHKFREAASFSLTEPIPGNQRL